MNSKLKNEHTDCFYRAVLGLRNLDECYAFFEDICTVSEIQAMALLRRAPSGRRPHLSGDFRRYGCVHGDHKQN